MVDKIKLLFANILIVSILFFIFIFGAISNVGATSINIDADYGAIYHSGGQLSLLQQPNYSTSWYWGYMYNSFPSSINGLEIYFHSGAGSDILSSSKYMSFQVAIDYSRHSSYINSFSVAGAVLKSQGATYYCDTNSNVSSTGAVSSVENNGTSTGFEQGSSSHASLTINCDISGGIDIGTSDNFASLSIQFNGEVDSLNVYILKTLFISDIATPTNAINNVNNSVNNVNNSVNNVNSSINNDSVDSSGASSSITNMANSQASSNVISDLLTMPITLIQKILNGMSGACTPLSIGTLWGTEIKLECVNMSSLLGIAWNIIDVICSGFLAFAMGKKFVVLFNKFTNLKEGGLEEAYD